MLACCVTIHGETLKRGAMLLGEKLSDEETGHQACAALRSVMTRCAAGCAQGQLSQRLCHHNF